MGIFLKEGGVLLVKIHKLRGGDYLMNALDMSCWSKKIKLDC